MNTIRLVRRLSIQSNWFTQTIRSFSNDQEFLMDSFPKEGLDNFVNTYFWVKPFHIYLDNEHIQNHEHIMSRIGNMFTKKELDLPETEFGAVIVPHLNLFVPVQKKIFFIQRKVIRNDLNIFQTSSFENVGENKVKVPFVVLGYKSKHETIVADHPINGIRLKELNEALKEVTDITGEQLLGEEYLGTPPSRIYRAFITPRTEVDVNEPTKVFAQRCASQILISLRKLIAERTTYLRNTDKTLNNPNDTSVITQKHPIVLVLDNVFSALNVGSMFRTGETASIKEIVTCGITPHPPHPKLKKTALYAEEIVPTRHFNDVSKAIATLKEEGYTIMTMETTSLSKPYTDIEYPKKIAIVLGNEKTGVDPKVIAASDLVVEIPTYGMKNSLNVASVAPIMVFDIIRQWNLKEKK